MPKQIWKLENFHGGLSSNSDPRDIADNELAEATDVMVDEVGKIRTMGGTAAVHSDFTTSIQPGYGLFQFSSDYKGADGTEADGEEETDYIAMWDNSNSTVDIFKSNVNGIFIGIEQISLGGTGGKPCFYYVDGALRISDGAFGTNNVNKWYGYIKREICDDLKSLDAWYIENQELAKPDTGLITFGGMDNLFDVFYLIDNTYRIPDGCFSMGVGLQAATAFGANRELSWRDADVTKTNCTCTDKTHNQTNPEYPYPMTGDDDILTEVDVNADGTWSTVDASTTISITTSTLDGTANSVCVFPIKPENTQDSILIKIGDDASNYYQWSFSANDLHTGWNLLVPQIDNDYYVGVTGSPDSASNYVYIGSQGDAGEKYFISNPTFISTENLSTGFEGEYKFYYSWLYGVEKAESDLYAFAAAGNTSYEYDSVNILGGALPFYFRGIFHDSGSVADNRLTGARVYWEEQAVENLNQFNLIGEWDFLNDNGFIPTPSALVQGTGWGTNTGEVDSRVSYANIGLTNGLSTVYTHADLTEFSPIDDFLFAKYKTAVVANRMVYVANVEVDRRDGSTALMGDAMIKSPVNKFDIFSESRMIEASVRDGDSIVKLEEYADRILQFKKNKMHLINISQEIEFLEDTFMHKGVTHPAATCKTDFGIAWVNKHGVYLYDGQRVNNLLEKKGRQIIKESDWEGFITDYSIIGYIPPKRQLLIIDSVNSEYSDGNRYLYDMVTQSWVKSEKENIIDNPSFEEGDSPFADWTATLGTYDGTEPSWTQGGTYKHDGTYSAEWEGSDNQTSSGKITSSHFALTSGKSYTLSWWGRFNIDPTPTMTIHSDTANASSIGSLDSDGTWENSIQYNGWGYYGDADTIDTWQYYSVTFRVPSGYSNVSDWTLRFFASTVDSLQMWIDDVSLIEEGNSNMTNLSVDWDGGLIYAVSSGTGNYVEKWSDTSGSTNSLNIITKDIDFGQPAQRKKVYKVYVTYTGGIDNNVDVLYQTNGNSGWLQFDGDLDSSSTGQVEAELKPNASINNIKSIQLKFDGTAASTFEINDISIVYRLKPAR